jgi:uncharacterized protein YjiK
MNIPYDLKNPEKIYKLPKKYVEISGISPIQESDSFAFVQDEAIRVYRFDLSCKEITKYVKHGPGDAEDIVILGNNAYILHAGKRPAIYKIIDYKSESSQCERYDLNLKKEYDPEGLCYDANDDRLLIACKGSPVKGDNLRKIFSFDIQSMTRSQSPVFIVDSREFLNSTGDTFNPSGIAIHPESNDIYLVGTKKVKMIVCYGLNGVFKGAWKLGKETFIQPEGIAFMESGELIICSEGERSKNGKRARVFIFST